MFTKQNTEKTIHPRRWCWEIFTRSTPLITNGWFPFAMSVRPVHVNHALHMWLWYLMSFKNEEKHDYFSIVFRMLCIFIHECLFLTSFIFSLMKPIWRFLHDEPCVWFSCLYPLHTSSSACCLLLAQFLSLCSVTFINSRWCLQTQQQLSVYYLVSQCSHVDRTPFTDTCSGNRQCKICRKSSSTAAGAGLFRNTPYVVRANVRNAEKRWKK